MSRLYRVTDSLGNIKFDCDDLDTILERNGISCDRLSKSDEKDDEWIVSISEQKDTILGRGNSPLEGSHGKDKYSLTFSPLQEAQTSSPARNQPGDSNQRSHSLFDKDEPKPTVLERADSRLKGSHGKDEYSQNFSPFQGAQTSSPARNQPGDSNWKSHSLFDKDEPSQTVLERGNSPLKGSHGKDEYSQNFSPFQGAQASSTARNQPGDSNWRSHSLFDKDEQSQTVPERADSPPKELHRKDETSLNFSPPPGAQTSSPARNQPVDSNWRSHSLFDTDKPKPTVVSEMQQKTHTVTDTNNKLYPNLKNESYEVSSSKLEWMKKYPQKVETKLQPHMKPIWSESNGTVLKIKHINDRNRDEASKKLENLLQNIFEETITVPADVLPQTMQLTYKETPNAIVSLDALNHKLQITAFGHDNLQQLKKRFVSLTNDKKKPPNSTKSSPSLNEEKKKSANGKELPIVFQMKYRNQTITVLQGDMTQLSIDAIVNPANEWLDHTGGLAKAIVNAGGYEIQKQSKDFLTFRRLQSIPVGDAIMTKAGNLPCKYVIHAVGPTGTNFHPNQQNLLSNAVKRSLEIADDNKIVSIAFPAISAGHGNYPIGEAVYVIASTVKRYLDGNSSTSLRNISFVDLYKGIANEFQRQIMHVFSPSSGMKKKDSIKPLPVTNRSLTIKKGNLEQTEADIIVNSVSSDLDFYHGPLSTAIVRAAGDEIAKECKKKGGWKKSRVIRTKGYKLPCKNVYHINLPFGKEKSKQIIQSYMDMCLACADEDNVTSIAFPSLGTGNLSYPCKDVAEVMVKTAYYHLNKPSTTLKEILLIIYPKDDSIFKAFCKQADSLVEVDGVDVEVEGRSIFDKAWKVFKDAIQS